ncbi:MAG: DUF5362 family protein [Phycisphaerales bacterium]
MSQMDSPGVPPTVSGPLGVGDGVFSPGMRALVDTSGWLKFIGVLAIINGVLTALTIFGIVIAWLPIWIGVLLYKAGSSFFIARESEDAGMASRGAESLASAIKIVAITMLVVIFIYVAGFAIVIGGMLATTMP